MACFLGGGWERRILTPTEVEVMDRRRFSAYSSLLKVDNVSWPSRPRERALRIHDYLAVTLT